MVLTVGDAALLELAPITFMIRNSNDSPAGA